MRLCSNSSTPCRPSSPAHVGGVGLYSDGTFFGVIDNDTLFFKVDEALAGRYRARGMPPFAPMPGAKPMLSYYQVPADVLEDAGALARWARESVAAARVSPPRSRRSAMRPRR